MIVVNCFEADLPASLCHASTVEVLSLNGLGAAEGCPNTVKFPFSGVSLFNAIGGTLPDCVWHLPLLTTLHLTGNGLTGGVISQLPNNSRIEDLSLAHNKFSGNIPLHVQQVQRVDLSYNQFSGKYDGGLSVEPWMNRFLDLEINRLSGQLPASRLENVSNLNVLRGNMFSCDTIPDNDQYVNDYTCGSEDLNESLYVFGSALFVTSCVALVACLAVVLFASKPTLLPVLVREPCGLLFSYMTCVGELKSTDIISLQPIVVLCEKFMQIKWLFVQLFFVMLAIGAPVYIARSSDVDGDISTHTNTYFWFWTLAYLRGVVPSSLMLVSWIVAITVCFHRIVLAPLLEQTSVAAASDCKDDVGCTSGRSSNGDVVSTKRLSGWGKDNAGHAGIMLINASVVISVNTLYIYATQQPVSAFIRFCMQLSLAVFRLVYTFFVFPVLSRTIVDPIAKIVFRLSLLIVNNLVVPIVVTAFASPSCFQVLYRKEILFRDL
jgi:hypothetical protein